MLPCLDAICLVAFDLDGTLIDSVPDIAVAVDAMLEDAGLPTAGVARVRDWVGNGSRKLVERALAFATGSVPGDQMLNDAHEAFLRHYGRAPCARTRVYPGVREALTALRERELVLVVITNKPHAFVAPILEALGLAGYFDLTLGGDSLPQKKPDPAPLLHVAERFGIAPRHCLMVGDSRHDIEAARRAGFHALAVPYGYNHGEPISDSQPDAVVESLGELV
ncbi:phosphoglycolate phosphatase [Modicisalibacter ilicicola DSM 19980]|uniref:Phosphoglycolate phosphatase n=1 Tax=Modicisalibacter ilicicola DSM 19980 TaxID=1121942 RepID=A0A1M4X482_9GAMM|nr:phosphoglycolate phosphatase [Halomonas ilicicola]SHE88281.1 phosphoglycolate phosphatase [Halomonas ilicicola DSM 19980]